MADGIVSSLAQAAADANGVELLDVDTFIPGGSFYYYWGSSGQDEDYDRRRNPAKWRAIYAKYPQASRDWLKKYKPNVYEEMYGEGDAQSTQS